MLSFIKKLEGAEKEVRTSHVHTPYNSTKFGTAIPLSGRSSTSIWYLSIIKENNTNNFRS